MTKEELLQPRYKVIADYPLNPYKIGHIIRLHYPSNEVVEEDIEFFGRFPHLFKRLEWWEDRKVEAMPEYVKCEITDFIKFKKGQIIQVEKFHSNTFGQYVSHLFISKDKQGAEPMTNCLNYMDFSPATEEEYTEYQKQLTNQ